MDHTEGVRAYLYDVVEEGPERSRREDTGEEGNVPKLEEHLQVVIPGALEQWQWRWQ